MIRQLPISMSAAPTTSCQMSMRRGQTRPLTGHNKVGFCMGTSKRAGLPGGTFTWIHGTSALREQYLSVAHTTHSNRPSSSMRPFRASSVRLRTTSLRAQCAGALRCVPKSFASKGQCSRRVGFGSRKVNGNRRRKERGRESKMVCLFQYQHYPAWD